MHLIIPPRLYGAIIVPAGSELTACTAIADVENSNFEILALDLMDMLVTEITMKHGEILCGAGKDVFGAEGAVAKACMFGRGQNATAPLAFYDRFACHCDGDQLARD